MDPDSRLALTTFIWIFGLGGVFGILYAVFDGLRSRRSANWPSTSGRVIESELRAYKERSRGISDRRDRRGTTMHLRYEYTVGGRRFVGHRARWVDVQVGDGMGEMIAAHPVGRAVTVYYDPAAPQNAVLEPGAAVAGSFSMILGSLFFLAIALVMRGFRGA